MELPHSVCTPKGAELARRLQPGLVSRMEMEAAWPSKDKAGKANWDS